MLDILAYFSSFEFYFFAFFLILVGAITQSAIGIGFGVPACFLVLSEPSMVPSCIVLMGTFLASTNALLSYRDILKKDLIYSFSGRVIGTFVSIPLISLTIGTNNFLIIFGLLLLITVFLSAKKWNIKANIKNLSPFINAINNFFLKTVEFPKVQSGGKEFNIDLNLSQKDKIRKIYASDYDLVGDYL